MPYQLGIIGGMGSLATTLLFDYIVKHTDAEKDQDHIDTIILNHASLPDRTEAILTGNTEPFLREISKDIQILNDLKVKVIAIPCNTAHYFYDHLQKKATAHVFNMIEETILYAKRNGASRLMIFGTDGTIQSKLYHQYGKLHEMDVIQPDQREQAEIMQMIYQIKQTGALTEQLQSRFDHLIDQYTEISTVVLACTELSTLPIYDESVIDALQVLGDCAVRSVRSDS